MPKPTFLRLPDDRRELVVREAIVEFAEQAYAEASLSRIARRTGIAKGSFYQYFDDKLDLYRWLLTEEVPRRKREFVGAVTFEADFWQGLETFVERGMAFLVEHPRLARLAAAAADPTAIAEVRGLHLAICEAGIVELRALLEAGAKAGAIARTADLDVATRLVATVIGPGLTDVVLRELDAELHEVLASPSLREKLGTKRRRRLAHAAVLFIRGGLGASQGDDKERNARKGRRPR
jgi:AcrR family transcriptional regulator